MNNNEIKRLRLPTRLEALLGQGDHGLQGHVRASIGDFEFWLADDKLVFFPEYTDHGISHVEQVLATADWLLPGPAIEAMGATDAAVLILISTAPGFSRPLAA